MAGFLSRRPHLYTIAAVVLICCMSTLIYSANGWCAPAPTKEALSLSATEKEQLVQKAVVHYEKGEKDKARESLETAQTVFPENYAVPYYLGLIYLEQGNRKGAVSQWQKYLKMAPQNENALNIRKNVTLLLRDEARAFAKQALARETKSVDGRVSDKTIAVTTFSNLGSERLGPLGKGMASMLITDLSKVPDLQVVDRIQLHALLEEMKLGTSGLVDMNTAPKVGKLLQAKHVASGSLADFEKGTMMIASAVMDTNQSTSIGAQEAQGVIKQFYDLEKQIACQIIEDLGKHCDTVPAGFNKIHTKNLTALIWYSWGLEYFDEESYDDARDMFQKAIEEDPQFDLAAFALLATPTSTMASMGTTQMISSASAGGPSSAVAPTAVVGTSSGTGSAIAATSAAGGVGFPPVTAIVAGVAAVGGGVALAGGGGGGGGDSPAPPPPSAMNLTGDWSGTWIDATGASGAATFSLTQTGNAVSGTVSVTGDDCLTAGDISGSVSGNTANLTIRSGAETVALSASSDNTAKTMTGTWNYTASSAGCADETGNFSSALTTGGADISW
jgi:tetratricopeptide (TPR) repeat protein